MLGVPALLGRTFLAGEGDSRPVVLSYRLWQRRFSGDKDIVGRHLTFGDRTARVVGVMPAWFAHPGPDVRSQAVEIWNAKAYPPQPGERRGGYLTVIGRIRRGSTLAQARNEMSIIGRRLEQQYPQYNAGYQVRVVPLHEELLGDVEQPLWFVLGAVGLLLLIACANVANLVLSRAAERGHEFAVRAALGASRGRLMRQMLVECLAIALLGGAAGVIFAWWGTESLAILGARHIPRIEYVRIDSVMLAFALVVSLLTGLTFGLFPARRAARADMQSALKEAGRIASRGPRRQRASAFLVVSEVALSFLLLIGAALLIQSFLRLQQVPPGFDPHGVLTAEIALPWRTYPNDARARQFHEALVERVATLPGVETAAEALAIPLKGTPGGWAFDLEGRPWPQGRTPDAESNVVTPGYFRAVRVPLRQGRFFTSQDGADSPRVAIVNETMARLHFGGQDPIGRRIGIFGPERPTWCVIVGVVADVRYHLAVVPAPQLYLPFAQQPYGFMHLVVRASGDPAQLTRAIRHEVRQIDPKQAVSIVLTMEQIRAESLARERFAMLLLALFGAAALLLASVGIYGVVSSGVTQRQKEMGIRMALGARPSDVRRLIVFQGLGPAFLGLAMGTLAALALKTVIAGLLYGISAGDPFTFIATALFLTAVAALACYLPARRASRLDPLIVLQEQ